MAIFWQRQLKLFLTPNPTLRSTESCKDNVSDGKRRRKKRNLHISTKMLGSEYTYDRILNYPWMNCPACFLKYLTHLFVIEVNSLKNNRDPRAREPLNRLAVRDKKHI